MSRKIAFGLWAMLVIHGVSRLGAEPIEIGDAAYYRLGGYLELLVDETRKMSFSQVREASGWRAVKEDEPNPGFTDATSWVRFRMTSRTEHPLILVYRYANIDFVDLFVLHEDGRHEHFASGNHIPLDKRSIAHRYPLFPLNVARGESVWCYVQVRNEQGIIFPISVWSDSAFHAADYREQLIIGMFIGLFLLVILFNTLFFLATGDRAYLSYVLMVLFYLFYEFAYRGIGGAYLWPKITWIDDQVLVISASLAMVMGLIFTRGFLQTRTWVPRMHRFLGVIQYVTVANALGAVILPFKITVVTTNALLFVIAVGLVPNAFIVLRRGFRAARFYLAAWMLMLTGGVIFAMLNFSLVPSTLFTANAMTFGSAFQVVLLSFAVVDRILLLRRDRENMQRERLEAVEKSLYSDSLTELPNRNRLVADLAPGASVTVILVNIDHFKEINDYFGQKAGDNVIIELGNRIRTVISDRGGRTYRLHADEFAVVIDGACGEDSLKELGRRLEEKCQEAPYFFESEALRLDISIGIAVADTRHLEKADMALTASRAKNSFVIYHQDLEVIKRYADNLHWLHVIRESIDQDRIVPFFQPIMDNRSGAIEKFESLMRIKKADGAVISPGAFLTIAKKSKIYPELSCAIVGKTAHMMRGGRAEVSINVSVEDIVHPDVLAEIERAVSETDVGSRIVFELLESEGIENYEEVSRFIERMKSRGCKIAIDDFGSGYSNFGHILRLNVDYLKLDASLIKPIAEDGHARTIVETIVSFARKLGIRTIAEFVHNAKVQDIVREIGVDFSQGYFIGEPRPHMSVTAV